MLMDKNQHQLRSWWNNNNLDTPIRLYWCQRAWSIIFVNVKKLTIETYFVISSIFKTSWMCLLGWVWYQKGRGSKFHSLNTQFNFWNPHPFSSHKLDCWAHKNHNLLEQCSMNISFHKPYILKLAWRFKRVEPIKKVAHKRHANKIHF